MQRFAMMIVVAVVAGFVCVAACQAAPAALPVTNGLVCWYDAAVGVTVGSNGVVQAWHDLSGNNHYGTLAAGSPVRALNQINSKPAIQFRTSNGPCGFNVDGPLFVEEQYVVVRSPHDKWNSDGCFFGRRWARSSSYRLGVGTAAFWGDQYPVAVSRNGKPIGDRPFDMAPITEFMVLKIDVNDGDMSRNTYQIGMADTASCDFDVAEIIGYASPLSSNEEAAVGIYLATKYAIRTSYSNLTSVATAPHRVSPPIPAKTSRLVVLRTKPVLLVTNGLACWYDAAVGVTLGSNGMVQTWKDLSGNAHHATPGRGAPVLALNQINYKPMVQFRGNWLDLAGTFFAKEQYVVLRSPHDKWNAAGSFLGRLKGRGSSCNTWCGDTGFWTDQSPAGVTRNGTVLPGPAFDCSPITNCMILRIVVNDNSTNEASYAIGNNDGLAGCDFDVAEIIGYQSLLSPLEEALVGGYLAAKYGLCTEYPPLPGVPQAARPEDLAPAKYKGWQHSGSLYVLTTPDGANLPASALEENVPVLVRLNKDWFNFSEAKANGDDIRFATGAGVPLAYQIDEWNAAAGTALIWVRIPTITGNARQEIKMYWGNTGAASESSGPAVFNKSNGYLSVWHMNDPVKDDAGTLESVDMGTTSSSGMIGQGRHFPGGKGINCGDRITTYPFASSPHTSEAWFRAERFNATILSWGKSDAVALRLQASPATIAVYSHEGSTCATSVIQKAEWVQVVYAYNGRYGQIYVNAQPDLPAAMPATMRILTPVRMEIGTGFVGDIDEARISKWARSADWVKLQYENQKPLQTVVGPLVQPGTEFSVSEKKVDIREGNSITVTAKAGGAQKVCWIVKRDGHATIADVDRFNFTIDAGRVTGDQSFTLQFKAVYADGIKTIDIPVTIREDIPDPLFTLKAPSKWDGREMIEIVPQIANLKEMQAKNAAELKYEWTVPPLVEADDIVPGRLILKRARNSGSMTLTATVSNGGTPVSQAFQIEVKEPAKDVWVQRTPGKDEKPVDNQFYARDDKNQGTLYYNGILSNAADTVFLKVYANNQLFKTESQKLDADNAYAFSVKLAPGLVIYRVEFGSTSGGVETVLHTITNLVCGDAYVIDGQSNAEATQYGNDDNPDTTDWIRTYRDGWHTAFHGGPWCVGYWGLELARSLMQHYSMPICIINGAVGGTRIDQHMPDPGDHYCFTNHAYSIYGNLLTRVAAAKLTHGIRGVLWHQGEADQGTDGPDGGYGWETYQHYFLDMTAAWKKDMPNIQHCYLYQIWPNACGQGGTWHADKLRDLQRVLPRLYSNMGVMPTLGIKPEGYCHYPAAGYAEMARLMTPLVERDNYGKVSDKPITAPDLQKARYASDRNDEIVLEFDQPMVWTEALTNQFYLDGKEGMVISGSVSGNVITLKLASASAAKTITYLIDRKWDPRNLLYGQNGIAALTFCEVPIDEAGKQCVLAASSSFRQPVFLQTAVGLGGNGAFDNALFEQGAHRAFE